MEKREITCDCEIIHADKVHLAAGQMPSETALYDLSDFFKVFGDSTRIKIMWALDKTDLCVCDLAALLGMTKSAISHQLRSLRAANLVTYKKQGKIVLYSLADNHIKTIIEMGFEHISENHESIE